MPVPSSSDSPGCFGILQCRNHRVAFRNHSVGAKNIKKKKLELPSVAFPAEGGWRNSGLSGGSLPRSLGPPQPQCCSPPALFPAEPVPVCQDLFPAQGPSLLFLLCSTAGARFPPSHGHERLFQGCHKLHRADTDCTPGECFPYAFICNVTGLFYRHCALVFQTGLDFFLYYPMTKRCGGSREKSLTATVPASRKA